MTGCDSTIKSNIFIKNAVPRNFFKKSRVLPPECRSPVFPNHKDLSTSLIHAVPADSGDGL